MKNPVWKGTMLILVMLFVGGGLSANEQLFTITAYTAGKESCGDSADGFTATMHKLKPGDRVVAVDPKVIPLKSWVHIEGMGWYQALDVGGAIKGNKIDVWFLSLNDALEFGRQKRAVHWQKEKPTQEQLKKKKK